MLALAVAIPTAVAALVATSGSGSSLAAPHPANAQDAKNQPGPSICPVFERMPSVGRIGNRQLVEASGLVASDRNPGVLWSHNDSGGRPELFALTFSGQPLAEFNLSGADAVDWEDVAIGPGPEPRKRYLYVGDIGDNDRKRANVVVYRVEEPQLAAVRRTQPQTLKGVARFELSYEDAAHDAEALFVDPKSSDLYVITKPLLHTPRVYQAKAPHSSQGTGRLIHVASLDFVRHYSMFPPLVTAADMSRDRRWILVRTYVHAFLYQCLPNQSIADCFRNTPCVVPLHLEPQGEAIAFTPDGNGYFSTSEGRAASIYLFRRKP